MKITLYLVVLIAAFALVEESAEAGLLRQKRFLGGLLKITLDNTLTGVGDVAKKSIQDITNTLEGLTNTVKKTKDEAKKNIKDNQKEVTGNVEEIKKTTEDKLKQFIKKLKEGSDDLNNKVKNALDEIYSKSRGDWKEVIEETRKKSDEIIDKYIKEAKSNSNPEDIKEKILSDMEKLADNTASRSKCGETEKKEFKENLYNKLEDLVNEVV